LIYTATDAAAVNGINALFHGPTTWVIGKDDKALTTGWTK
jgi:hypothetical protein